MITVAVNARVVDLCCGMGGLSVAAREMGMRVVAGREERCSVVGVRCWKGEC